ncbi:hypothetical protein NE662_09265, partial [Bifidobacterium pseudocatenulatum]|nr:hypothetical protein [Bifidobacterium pseudocatenulatum]
ADHTYHESNDKSCFDATVPHYKFDRLSNVQTGESLISFPEHFGNLELFDSFSLKSAFLF